MSPRGDGRKGGSRGSGPGSRSSGGPRSPGGRSGGGQKGRPASGSGRPAGSRKGAPRSGAKGPARRGAGSDAGRAKGAERAPSRTTSGTSGPRSGPRTGPERGLGGGQVEGRHAVRELLLAGRRRVSEVLVASDLDASPVVDEILGLAEADGVAVRRLARSKLEAAARTEAPQGVVAFAAPVEEHDLDALATGAVRATASGDGPPFLLALDGLTDPGNLGAVLRSASAAGVTGVVLPRHRAVHLTPTVAKAAAGAIEHLPMAVVGGLPAALSGLRDHGVWTIGLDAEGERSLWDLEVADQPVALVVGAEGSGLSRLVGQRCDQVVSIPMRGPLDSLNAATAAALACFEVARGRGGG